MALSPAFEVYEHGIPDKDFDIVTKRTRASPSLAEVGTLQMEFKYLARLTRYSKYQEQVDRISDSFAKQVEEKYTNGLLPVQVNQHTGKITTSKITMGANGDSYYEYLLKQWLLSGKKDEKFKTQYMIAVDGIMDKLLGKSKPNGFVFIGELVYGKFEPKMDHLVCFVPGMLALGYQNGMPEEHLTLAKQLMETCYQMYAQMEAKLAPEIMYFNMKENVEEDLLVSATDAFNLLRPETVESLMVLYRVTKDEKYREYGREIMKAFEKNCRLERGGYASIGNVAKGPIHIGFRNEMESFFIAETLKYLFLLFSDDSMLALDEIVFNTEAHPVENYFELLDIVGTDNRQEARDTMPSPNENSPSLALDPLHSPGSDTQEQQPPPVHTAPEPQETDFMKTKRRMFSSPLLRRSATASSAAAASAASRIKSNLSTVKLPTALKRASANSGRSASDDKDTVDRAPTVPSLSRSSTDSSVKKEDTKGKVFNIPSLMRKGTNSNPLSSPARSNTSRNNSEAEASNDDEAHETMPQASAINTASRFVKGMPTMLRRVVSSNHTPPTSSDDPVTTKKRSPDTSANSTPRGQFPEDDFEEEDRHSLLMMMQVPEARRNSQVPLMAATEAW
ncbi:Mannosyl-oligosaccharide alpha-1,2-mannosidase [Phytophthora megakarya]|uniref:alpha-1,2-Mannosidase n=1 Tax=Phytophthora megakarya TaxID=4795 RepID=A0A225VQH8_9STRA|nr:Mannosyl-oligosaccharide alpha-1,2-mannosidase [Phytophthora megakarya]